MKCSQKVLPGDTKGCNCISVGILVCSFYSPLPLCKMDINFQLLLMSLQQLPVRVVCNDGVLSIISFCLKLVRYSIGILCNNPFVNKSQISDLNTCCIPVLTHSVVHKAVSWLKLKGKFLTMVSTSFRPLKLIFIITRLILVSGIYIILRKILSLC